ncbi:uncharacterized protein C8A04DRAFT_13223 [Dichotomopilus funicola]|uniref:Rhodopsin domain-containing protein n=1 Tax=Dichotomopilus funicola TaxID=1934379 RepID=A0AAN6V071_9PEZI|nr:hypothetical protein C8A04DRAFT_13223 [Dichotomopilus funicola]
MPRPSPYPELDGESRVGAIVAILVVGSVLSTSAVVLRCYSRAVMLRCFGLDDAVMIPAQILTIASAIAIGLEAKYGLGRHVWMMPEKDNIPYMKCFYVSIIVYNVGMALTKISTLLLYKRIFNHTMMHKVVMYGLAFLVCWAITLCFLLPMVCMPVAAFWDPSVKGFCLDNGTIWYVMAGVNLVTDFTVFSLPIPVISSLQLPKKQKAMLLIVFTLGVFPCAVSIYRIRTLSAAAKSTDPTWDNVDAATFSFLELAVGVIAVCLPTLRPILMRAMPRVFGSYLRSNPSRSAGAGGTGGTGSRFGGTRSSRLAFGRGGTTGGSSVVPVVAAFKGGGNALRGTASTEGLRRGGDEEEGGLARCRTGSEEIIEFGELDKTGLSNSPGGRNRYSVSVVAGWDPDGGTRLGKKKNKDSISGGAGGNGNGGRYHHQKESSGAGIQATTTVTQMVTFTSMMEEENERRLRETKEMMGARGR